MKAIQDSYNEKICQLQKEEVQLKKVSNGYLPLKLATFVSGAYFIYCYFSLWEEQTLITALLLFVCYFICCRLDNRCRQNIDLLKRKQKVCRNELDALEDDYHGIDDGERYRDEGHAYAYDLDLFGKQSFFHRINRTVTEKGSNLLARRLTHLPSSTNEINDTQAAVQELTERFEERIQFLSYPHIANHLTALQVMLRTKLSSHVLIRSWLPYVLIIPSLLTLLGGMAGILSWYYFQTFFLLNLLVSSLFRKTLTRTNVHIELLHKEFKAYRQILQDIHRQEFQSAPLREIRQQLFGTSDASLKALQSLSGMLSLFNLRGNDLMYILLNGTCLFDLLLVRKFLPWCKEHLPLLEQWTDCIAAYDVLMSLSNYAYNHPQNTYGELVKDAEEVVLEAIEVYHPFLRTEKAVANDFTLNKQNIAIVTGANMAGKSTFLRTIGLNYVMACNGLPVCAKRFRFTLMSLFSSMRTTDNLSKDISYFHAELLRLEQLLNHVNTHPYTLLILDEILKGTNSKDKLQGSMLFLQEIARHPVSALIATHDLELARLEDDNPRLYSNYRFEIELAEEIRYTYKMEKGIAQNLNASYLLNHMLNKFRK